MLRLGALFIVLCMVLIAGSAGAVLFLLAGFALSDAALVSIGVLTALALYNAVTSRLRDRSDVAGQIADLSRGTADLSRQVAEIGRRVLQLEGLGDATADKARSLTAPITSELSELGTLVKQLADSVASHDSAIAALKESQAKAPPPAAAVSAAPAAAAASLPAAESRDISALVAAIRGAVEANRVDLYLQPIVTLPQRKVRYYEALTRLRTEEGQQILPSEFIPPAEASGLMPRIDNMLLFRSVQVVRRLLLKNRDVGLFCNIASATLNDGRVFPEMVQFLEANRVLAPSLVLEFRQDVWRGMGPIELEGLAALREMGFRFCMDRVTELRMEPKDLAERGIRFVKAPAALLLGPPGAAGGSDIHAADLSDLLGRFGISLIASGIEAEAQVVDLLDYDLRFGQGFLFSPPRPVRAEALQGPDHDAEKTGESRAAIPAAPAA